MPIFHNSMYTNIRTALKREFIGHDFDDFDANRNMSSQYREYVDHNFHAFDALHAHRGISSEYSEYVDHDCDAARNTGSENTE